MAGDVPPESDNEALYMGVMKDVLVETFKQVEPFAPVLVVRELDAETGEIAYVSRPILPVAQTEVSREEILEHRPVQDAEQVIGVMSEITQFSQQTIKGPGRKQELADVRHIAMHLVRGLVEPQLSYQEIGRAFGNRNHATVIHGIRRAEELLGSSWEYERASRARTLIREANKLLGLKYESVGTVISDRLICLCLEGLAESPVIHLNPKKRSPLMGGNMALDWEQATQTAATYRRYGNAALTLARNLLGSRS